VSIRPSARATPARADTSHAKKLHVAVLAHEPETGLGAFATQLEGKDVSYDVLCTTAGALPDHRAFDGTIALGGSLGVHDARLLPAHEWVRDAVLAGQPFLGVCLGGQLLASALGARVARGRPEVGVHDIHLTDAAERDPLFGGLPARLAVLGWHEDAFDLPRGAVPLAGSIRCTYEAFRFGPAAYGLQFHPEVRVEELGRWRHVAGYRELATRTGSDLDRLTIALGRATPALDALAEQLLGRWLNLAAGVAALTPARIAA
jgi:GMP synthase-like glutamine amidotransferase